MEECIFCKIIKKEIPSYKIYENDHTYVFLDIAKDIYGHTLVIPKKHYKNILDCDLDVLKETISTVKLISNHYMRKGFDGINIYNNNEECAHQVVPHLHFHIIPRKNNDNIDLTLPYTHHEFDLDKDLEELKYN